MKNNNKPANFSKIEEPANSNLKIIKTVEVKKYQSERAATGDCFHPISKLFKI